MHVSTLWWSYSRVFRMLFEKPVLLTADHWYVAVALVSSPSGASSDAGSSGKKDIQGPERSVHWSYIHVHVYIYMYMHVHMYMGSSPT